MVAEQRGPAAARPTRSPSTPRRASRPGSRPPTARAPRACSRTPRRRHPTWSAPATSCRCGPRRRRARARPGTPRRPSTSAGSPASRRSASIGELVDDDGSMTRLPTSLALAAARGAAGARPSRTSSPGGSATTGSSGVADDRACRTVATAPFRAHGYRDLVTGDEHVALVSPHGEPRAGRRSCACTPSASPATSLGSQRCDCGPQLRPLARAGRRARAASSSTCAGTRAGASACWPSCAPTRCRTRGLDTVDAQLDLGLPVDAREYAAAAAILADLGRQPRCAC